ncbi:MAG: UDP-N-acetylmuramoyl-tripeptide--D-alanyl-D-alanine ligase [Spirochaetaceae bacterium]|jgi:UDP-N-acetylmuramoyl-tripeptide--D-alanyl-D-alanine ligase|nr:UDP-N-acetylmuramoyl-tripeptide--D-alanyl-D-alanine ligase [Spirochaetaceae bacterium]
MTGPVLMDYQSAAKALGARLLPQEAEGGFRSVAIDSRKVSEGALFVALRGLTTEGHRYLSQAFEAGAAAALVTPQGMEEAGWNPGAAAGVLLVVDDTLKALQDLAAAYLDRFPRLLRVGITGSSGKTTTKEISAAMAGGEKKVVINPGNLNSETGLPLAAFGVRDHHEVGIFEAGMNRRGEIAELAAVLKPRIALITNIGPAHIGILGSMEAIAEEKKDIFSRFTGKETALIPEDDPFRDYLARDVNGRVVFYGQKNLEASGKLTAIHDRGLEGTEIVWEGVPAGFGLPGRHNVQNALAAAALAGEAGISGPAIRRGLESVRGLFGRSEVLRGKTTLIRDCYNANPDSAAEALAFCDGLSWPGRRVYIMGSMLELGDREEEAHRKLGEQLASSRADLIFLYGREMQGAAEALKEKNVPFFYERTLEALRTLAAGQIRPGDLVLLKGSRGCALEGLTNTVLLQEETDVS